MRITVEITLPEGTEPVDIDIEQVWDHFFFQTPEGTIIRVTKEEDGKTVSFE